VADGGERLLFTVLADVVAAVGFALLLLAASELAGGLSELAVACEEIVLALGR